MSGQSYTVQETNIGIWYVFPTYTTLLKQYQHNEAGNSKFSINRAKFLLLINYKYNLKVQKLIRDDT